MWHSGLLVCAPKRRPSSPLQGVASLMRLFPRDAVIVRTPLGMAGPRPATRPSASAGSSPTTKSIAPVSWLTSSRTYASRGRYALRVGTGRDRRWWTASRCVMRLPGSRRGLGGGDPLAPRACVRRCINGRSRHTSGKEARWPSRRPYGVPDDVVKLSGFRNPTYSRLRRPWPTRAGRGLPRGCSRSFGIRW
jgi:hypothetical protein